MMIIYRKFTPGILCAMAGFAMLMSSCIKDEALNTEADILSCEVSEGILIRKPVILNDEIKLYVNSWDDVTNLAPKFTLTEGAIIEPASGTTRDFSTAQTYKVTSQDGQWSKVYKVKFISGGIPTDYHFEHIHFFEENKRQLFHIFYEPDDDNNEWAWSSGNGGFKTINNLAPAADYPTSQSDEGYVGKCAKLVTRSTGVFGEKMKAPIAAGNLFLGAFMVNLIQMAKSTHFGVPFYKTPLSLSGYYKYKPGEVFTDKNKNVVTGRTDSCDIYAVLYEVTQEVPYLDGTNIKTHPNIVMLAQIKDRKESDVWRKFSIPFKSVNGREINREKLRAGKYNLAIVLSSSEGGAEFLGAVGSTLCVDELHLDCK